VMPARSSASQMSGSTPSSRKVVSVLSLSCGGQPLRRLAGRPNWRWVSSVRRTGSHKWHVCRAHTGPSV